LLHSFKSCATNLLKWLQCAVTLALTNPNTDSSTVLM
jgi:hypothetical protein